jgi:light-regulated signal transduction histidine kinase (bacteriophytochrome)
LRVIAGYLEMLGEDYDDSLDENARLYIKGAAASASRMQALISDLLRYAHVGATERKMEPVDLQRVFEQTLENLDVRITELDADISHDVLPTVLADASLIGQVFQNLISNAIKFHGDDPPRVHVGAIKEEDRWILSVKDNGIGFDPAQTARLFNIFQRLHTNSEYPGTGIGLAICKKIIEQHGGRLWAESEPGRGSAFSFSLPEAE